MNLENLNLRRNLPLGGIVAFSMCSVWSVFQLLAKSAAHPTPIFWLPAVLVELITAWAVYNMVEQARLVTKSNISKQDRRFYALMLAAFVVVATPTLGASVWANTLEFGNLLLGSLFPVGSIGCAIGVALPDVMGQHEAKKETRRKDEAAKRKEREKERQEMEAKRQRAEELRQKEAALAQSLAISRQALAILRYYAANPTATHGEAAAIVGKSRRTVGNYLEQLEEKKLVARDNGGVEVLVDLPKE